MFAVIAVAFAPVRQFDRYRVVRTSAPAFAADSAHTTVSALAANPSNCGASDAATRRSSVT